MEPAPEAFGEMLRRLLRGTVAEHLGDEDTAEACLVAGLAIARNLHDTKLLGELLPNASDAAYRRGVRRHA